MTPEQFCYWLQGFAELTEGEPTPDSAQWEMIKEHLNTVFNKVTVKRTSSKRTLLKEELEKKQSKTLEEVIDDMQRRRPGVTCDPFGPLPGDGRIC